MAEYRDKENHLITITAVTASSSGNNVLVAAVAGKKIHLVKALLIPDADSVKICFRSGTATNLTGQMNLSKAGNGFVLEADGYPHVITDTGEGLILNTDAAVTVAGYVHTYTE